MRFSNLFHIPAQVTPGMTYSGSSDVTINGVKAGTMPWSVKIELGSSVTTPAGTFTDTLHVTYLSQFPGETKDGTIEDWWAKGIGTVKHLEPGYEWTEELVWANVCGTTVGTLLAP